jgi:hypothetical protein
MSRSEISTWVRNGARLFAAAALVAACSSGGDSPIGKTSEALATDPLPGSTFEGGDGNFDVSVAGHTDWVTFKGQSSLSTGIDTPSGSSDNAFGQGTKEDAPGVTVVDGSIPPNKNDLTRFYVASELVNGQNFLYLGWERLVNIGNANLDFEINQKATTGFTSSTTGAVTLNRTAGDLLVTYDFSGSGTPTLGLLTWSTAANGDQVSDCYSANALPCWGHHQTLGSANAQGAVNTVGVTDQISGASLGVGLFGEAAINLTGAGVFPAGTCKAFGSAFVKSRSSSSFTAEVKDFIAPVPVDISNCVTIKLKKVDAAGNPLAGAVMQLWLDANKDGVLDQSPTPPDTQVTNPQGNCTTAVTGNAATDGICAWTISASGVYIGHELTPPNGYSAAPDQTQSVTFPPSSEVFTLTFTDNKLPGRINVLKKDAVSNVALAGAIFTLYPDNSGATSPDIGTGGADLPCAAYGDGSNADTCKCTTQANGTCSFLNVPQGDYWVVETTPPSGYFLPASPDYFKKVTIVSGTQPNQGPAPVTATFGDPRKYHTVILVCRDSDNALDPSSVTLGNGTTQLTISKAQAEALLGIANGDALCGITQASFGPQAVGANSATLVESINP